MLPFLFRETITRFVLASSLYRRSQNVIPKYMAVTDAAGHTESIAVRNIAKIVRDQDEAVLYFRDGSTLPIRVEDAERILK